METTASAATAEGISAEELQLAARNHGMPLEALRYPITPVGLHYLLIHYDIPLVDPSTWRLSVTGLVHTPVSLSLSDLRARPSMSVPMTFECAGNGRAMMTPRPISQPWLAEAVGTAEWTGVLLAPLLEEAGVKDGATEVLFTGMDRGVEGGVEQAYQRSLPREEALRDGVLLSYEINGEPLPPQHGFPLRLVVPGWYGMTNVKWLREIELLAGPFRGYQQERGYRFRQAEEEPGTPVTRMAPRSLMVPPGIPDFLTRQRFLSLGPCRLEGRAWSGVAPVERVDVSLDGGKTWRLAELGQVLSPSAWAPWTYAWTPDGPGTFELCCRARDAAGNEQPLDPPWNLGGYANNAVQRVTVTVR